MSLWSCWTRPSPTRTTASRTGSTSASMPPITESNRWVLQGLLLLPPEQAPLPHPCRPSQNQTGESYKDYCLQNRLHFRIRAAHHRIKQVSPKRTTAFRTGSTSASMPPITESNRWVLQGLLPSEQAPLPHPRCPTQNQTGDSYKNYCLQNRLHFRIHAAHHRIKQVSPKRTTAFRTGSTSASMPPITESNRWVLQELLPPEQAPLPHPRCPSQNRTGESYKNYCLQNMIHFRIHAAHHRIKQVCPTRTTASRTGSTSASMPPITESNRCVLQGLLPPEQAPPLYPCRPSQTSNRWVLQGLLPPEQAPLPYPCRPSQNQTGESYKDCCLQNRLHFRINAVDHRIRCLKGSPFFFIVFSFCFFIIY